MVNTIININMIKKTFTIEMYSHFKIHVIVTEDFEEALKKYCKDIIVEGIDKVGGLFIYHENKPWEGYILVSPTTPTSTVAHESFHATYRIMSAIGSELGAESEEPYAYLLGFITNKVVETLMIYDKKYPAVEGLEQNIVIEVNN